MENKRRVDNYGEVDESAVSAHHLRTRKQNLVTNSLEDKQGNPVWPKGRLQKKMLNLLLIQWLIKKKQNGSSRFKKWNNSALSRAMMNIVIVNHFDGIRGKAILDVNRIS